MSSNIEVKLDVLNQKASPALYSAALSNRPAASFTGRLFVDSDNPSTGIYRDTGTSWVQVAVVTTSSTPNLQSVCTVGNTYTGDAAFNSITIGHGGSNNNFNNTLVGQNAGNYQTTGIKNTTMGYSAASTLSTATDNTILGWSAGRLTTSSNNTFIGSGAGQYTTGFGNTMLGYNCDTGSSLFPSLGATQNIHIGYNVGSNITTYTSYNNFIGTSAASGYTGNGSNGLNTVIGSLLSVSATPTMTGNIMLGDNTGIKYNYLPSGNTLIAGTTDNGIQKLQVAGGIYAATIALVATSWSANTVISSPSTSSFCYVYQGAGLNTITLPTATGNNNLYTFINNSSMSFTINAYSGTTIIQKGLGTAVTSYTVSAWGSVQFIADGNIKFYQIVN